jgi:hypothetical protein
MPNHCTNLLSCTSGKTIGSIIKPYLTDKGNSIDFNKILPMPEGILKTLSSSTIEEITKERTPEEKEARDKEIEELQEQNLKDYGHKNWYDWCVAVWDTKWNAYSCYTLEDITSPFELLNTIDGIHDLGFQTAWSPPINVIRELAKLTGESLRMSYYDEGWMFGGEYLVNADGSETDNCYEDIDDCPEHLKEELEVQYFLDCRDDEDEEE